MREEFGFSLLWVWYLLRRPMREAFRYSHKAILTTDCVQVNKSLSLVSGI